jgi:hypothetical protein
MQKVEGSNPFSRFHEIPLQSGISSFWRWAAFGCVPPKEGSNSNGERWLRCFPPPFAGVGDG